MSDPKYNTYAGELRFDDDNIVEVNLQPDTENITVLLNGDEVTGGSGLPEVDSEDNGKVLTVVEGEWAAATPAAPPAELPAVTSSDNGDVLTVVEGAWAKAAPSGGAAVYHIHAEYDDGTLTVTETLADIVAAIESGKMLIMDFVQTHVQPYAQSGYAYPVQLDTTDNDEYLFFQLVTWEGTAPDLDNIVVANIYYEGSGEAGVPGSWAVAKLIKSFNNPPT